MPKTQTMPSKQAVEIIHHGAVNGVTGSCHQLVVNEKTSLLIDCGLFQGAETAGRSNAEQLEITFDIGNIKALLVTHCHIDHVGRIPYLLAAGFNQPIFATAATAALLPMVIEDALKIGVTSNKRLINLYLKKLQQLLVPIEYNQVFDIVIQQAKARSESPPKSTLTNALGNAEKHHGIDTHQYNRVTAKFKPAGHILGSAYIEITLSQLADHLTSKESHRVVFSGDLGATYTPLLATPKSPYRADTLVIESTYGDKNHQGRKQRAKQLKRVIEKAVADNGVVLIPAFSIGRTQELLYELEQIIYRQHKHDKDTPLSDEAAMWQQLEVIVDSPMAAHFTERYIEFKALWDKEAKLKLKQHRHPLDFSQMYTVDSHKEHMATIDYLSKRNKPAIVIAASGMCNGGRMLNYLKQFLTITTADVIFVGYQAQGTIGKAIQEYGPQGGYVYIEGKKIEIKAGIHTISGYSAHADQHNLINFVKRMHHKPKHIRIVHGDDEAKEALADEYKKILPEAEIEIGQS